ncbi:hypothetical protein CHU00_07715 [Sphingobacterium cellulitidis]|nr:hypothetical protein CHU00_07715 [Sphingobacterium cellulitidis]
MELLFICFVLIFAEIYSNLRNRCEKLDVRFEIERGNRVFKEERCEKLDVRFEIERGNRVFKEDRREKLDVRFEIGRGK